MENDQTLFTNGESIDITDQLPNVTTAITDMLAPFILLSLILSVIFIALYITSMIRRRKLENALFDIQKNLREMNERDKARSAPATPPPKPGNRNETIAAAESRNDTV